MTPRPLAIVPHRYPYPTIKRPLGRSKAVTIGVGFLCNDGLLLCADNQITWPDSHKYYERKIYLRMRPEWTVGFTFAGNPNLAKSFDGKLESAIGLIPRPYTAAKIQECIEALLYSMNVIDGDQSGLYMICAISVPNDDMIMLKTDRKIVSRVRDYDYVGVGDSSLLRHVGFLIGDKPEYRKVGEALPLAVYLVLQAKRYVDGCGGDTDALVIRPNGSPQDRSGVTTNMEQHLLHLESYACKVVRAAFDPSVDDATLETTLNDLSNKLKDVRGPLSR